MLVQKSFVQNFCTKKARVKCWWKWHHGSITLALHIELGAKIAIQFH